MTKSEYRVIINNLKFMLRMVKRKRLRLRGYFANGCPERTMTIHRIKEIKRFGPGYLVITGGCNLCGYDSTCGNAQSTILVPVYKKGDIDKLPGKLVDVHHLEEYSYGVINA